MAIHNNATADTKSDLYAIIPSGGTVITLLGDNARGDIIPVDYLYDDASIATDDYPNVIQPTLQTGAGRYIKTLFQQYQGDWNQTNSGAQDYIKNKPVIVGVPSISVVSRSLNTAFTPNADKVVHAVYSISISVTSTLLGTNVGTVQLQTSPDGSAWTTQSQVALSAAGVASTQIDTHNIGAFIPAGYQVKLLTSQSGANGATITYIAGQETTF